MTTVQDRPTPVGRPASDGSAAVSVRRLWKVFGPDPERILGRPDLARITPTQLREQTGCTAAVRDVSFDVHPGEVFVVMGLSGSGKSTLVRCLTRLVEPTSGEVLIDGEDVRGLSRSRLRELRRHKLAMVFQQFGLLAHRRVIDNVAYGLEVQGMRKSRRYERAREVLALVGLEGYDDYRPSQLSGGMQQRVGLARALAVQPEILLFDEPFSALDPLIRRDMRAEVARLHRELARTMVFITHDLAEALELGDRIAVMRDGAVVQVGTPEEVVGAPADDYVRDFVRDVPRADVLTAGSLARAARPHESLDGLPEVSRAALAREAVPLVAEHDRVLVVESGRVVVGVVDRAELLGVLVRRGAGGNGR